jgi:tRNA(Ile)-lysidine synthase
VTDSEADAALASLARLDRIVLAVSGGADSMALLALVAAWRARRAGKVPLISVATVDHRLRPESASEAEFVAKEASRLGIPHATLPWLGEKPATGIADAARDARYRLLDEHARDLAASTGATIAVVTAHHEDDQAETVAMRLARGAGVDGLAAMRPERALLEGSPVALLRPLLAFPKSRLLATLEALGVAFVDDPTNRDLRFERPRVRQMLPALEALGIKAHALATSARRLGDAQAALAYAEESFVATLSLSFGNEVFATFDRQAFEAGPALLRQKVLARLIGRYGGASPAPQLSEIEDLAARLDAGDTSMTTLGGAMISPGARFVRVWREAGRLDHADIMLAPGESRIWDRRFVVRRPAAGLPFGAAQMTPAENVTVRPLGAGDYCKIAARLRPGSRPPARAARALPSFWREGELLAVPSLAPFADPSAKPFDPAGYELEVLAQAPIVKGLL